MVNFHDYIEIDPNKRFGKPIIKSTRISVYEVLNWLANGVSVEEIITDFPEISPQAIQACLAYVSQRMKLQSVFNKY